MGPPNNMTSAQKATAPILTPLVKGATMIRRLTVKGFKRFGHETFELSDSVILAGPNNAGKSTVLQAVAVWKFGLDRWVRHRGGSKAVKRVAARILRSDFTAVPLREMNLLWEDRRINTGHGDTYRPRLMEIVAEGETVGESWQCGIAFQYNSPDVVYAKPVNVADLTAQEIRDFPPAQARDLQIVHVPPLFGLEQEEPRRERGLQDRLVGQGRAGEILRNLLWEIAEENTDGWTALTEHVHRLFGISVQRPRYDPAQPFITCEYREQGRRRPFDLSNAGSGTLQLLLLLAFLYARPASVLLLDEPDAHQHVILQRQVYDLIRREARERGGQVIVATHSEAILDATEPSRVLAFIGNDYRPLTSRTERDRLREALKRISTTDLLLAREVGAVLYVEGETDEKILTEWARILDHPARRFFDRPYIHRLGGRSLAGAKAHFFALRAAFPEVQGLCLLDGDNRDEPDEETRGVGLRVLRWHRYEIENYLLQPAAIKRFVAFPLKEPMIDAAFDRQVPSGADLFGDHVSLTRIKASSEFLVPLFEEMGDATTKRDLYLLAAEMEAEEIHPEVTEKLDRIAATLIPDAHG